MRAIHDTIKDPDGAASVEEIDAALTWSVQQRADWLSVGRVDQYWIGSIIIDQLLDARSGVCNGQAGPGVGDVADGGAGDVRGA